MKTIESNAFWEAFARILIAIPLVSYLLAVVVLWMGFSINGFLLPLSMVLVLGWEWSRKSQERLSWQVAVSVLLTMAITLLLSSITYDRSCDGPWYHSAMIFKLVEGWNPYYQSAIGDETFYTATLWVEHYARGIEMLAAAVVACVGNIESGKVVSLWFVIASIVYVYLFLRYTLPHLNRYLRVWLVGVIALNPIVVNQLFTYYIDWSLYTVLLISLVNLYLFFAQNKRWAMGMELLLLFFVPAIKFNIFFWIALWSAIAFLYLLIKFRYAHPYRITGMVAVVLLAGTVIGAYNPYITNWVEHETPMYPLAGEGAVDIMEMNTPLLLQEKSRIEAVLISLLSNPNEDHLNKDIQVFAVPHLQSSMSVDCRVGGFGIFFFESILLSFILFFCTKRSRRMWSYLAVAIGLFVSLFILPSGWWARYVAFFYLFPFVLMYYAEREGLKARWQKALHILILTLLSLDIALALGGVVVENIVYRHTVDYILNAMKQSGHEVELYTENYVFLRQLEERGIPYKPVEEGKWKEAIQLGSLLCIDGSQFDFESNRPWIFSLHHTFDLKLIPNMHYQEQ